jgi:hypothetical protein
MATLTRITPCLWFDTEGEEAVTFYTSIFDNSRIVHLTHYGSAGPRPEGMVMTVHFELDGQEFIALNGGPEFDDAARRACRGPRDGPPHAAVDRTGQPTANVLSPEQLSSDAPLDGSVEIHDVIVHGRLGVHEDLTRDLAALAQEQLVEEPHVVYVTGVPKRLVVEAIDSTFKSLTHRPQPA